jgi:hypothetical protein
VCSIGSIAALYYNRKRLGMTSKASSIKIVIGFYSLLAVLEQTFAIAWPAGFERTLSNLKAAFASVLDFSSFSCAVKADWFQRVAFLCLALIAVLVALAVAFARAVSKARVADRDATEGELVPLARQKGKVAFLLGKLFGVDRPPELDVEYSGKAFNSMLLMYPSLSPAVIARFNCGEVAGEFDATYYFRGFSQVSGGSRQTIPFGALTLAGTGGQQSLHWCAPFTLPVCRVWHLSV